MSGKFVLLGFVLIFMVMRGAGYVYDVQTGFLTQSEALGKFGVFILGVALFFALAWGIGKFGGTMRGGLKHD